MTAGQHAGRIFYFLLLLVAASSTPAKREPGTNEAGDPLFHFVPANKMACYQGTDRQGMEALIKKYAATPYRTIWDGTSVDKGPCAEPWSLLLPEKESCNRTMLTVFLDMDLEHNILWAEAESKVVQKVVTETHRNYDEVLAELQQICSKPHLVKDRTIRGKSVPHEKYDPSLVAAPQPSLDNSVPAGSSDELLQKARDMKLAADVKMQDAQLSQQYAQKAFETAQEAQRQEESQTGKWEEGEKVARKAPITMNGNAFESAQAAISDLKKLLAQAEKNNMEVVEKARGVMMDLEGKIAKREESPRLALLQTGPSRDQLGGPAFNKFWDLVEAAKQDVIKKTDAEIQAINDERSQEQYEISQAKGKEIVNSRETTFQAQNLGRVADTAEQAVTEAMWGGKVRSQADIGTSQQVDGQVKASDVEASAFTQDQTEEKVRDAKQSLIDSLNQISKAVPEAVREARREVVTSQADTHTSQKDIEDSVNKAENLLLAFKADGQAKAEGVEAFKAEAAEKTKASLRKLQGQAAVMLRQESGDVQLNPEAVLAAQDALGRAKHEALTAKAATFAAETSTAYVQELLKDSHLRARAAWNQNHSGSAEIAGKEVMDILSKDVSVDNVTEMALKSAERAMMYAKLAEQAVMAAENKAEHDATGNAAYEAKSVAVAAMQDALLAAKASKDATGALATAFAELGWRVAGELVLREATLILNLTLKSVFTGGFGQLGAFKDGVKLALPVARQAWLEGLRKGLQSASSVVATEKVVRAIRLVRAVASGISKAIRAKEMAQAIAKAATSVAAAAAASSFRRVQEAHQKRGEAHPDVSSFFHRDGDDGDFTGGVTAELTDGTWITGVGRRNSSSTQHEVRAAGSWFEEGAGTINHVLSARYPKGNSQLAPTDVEEGFELNGVSSPPLYIRTEHHHQPTIYGGAVSAEGSLESKGGRSLRGTVKTIYNRDGRAVSQIKSEYRASPESTPSKTDFKLVQPFKLASHH